jgi:hypothetical protein
MKSAESDDLRPTGIVTYLARHVIHQIEDIGDIRIS